MKIKAVERHGNGIRLIDQTRLPGEIVYLELVDYRDVIEAIKKLRVRGAPAIGIAAAYGMAISAHQTDSPGQTYIRRIADEFKGSRPTAVNLQWAVDRLLDRVAGLESQSPHEVRKVLWSEAELIHAEDREMCVRIGQHGASLINSGDSVLTHCHTGALATGGIGTALGIIYTARNQGKSVQVYADETRPLFQGARLTAWELQQEGIEVTLICDSVAATLMRQGKIDCVIVGADRIAANGDTANKIGTYSVAVLARAHEIPFYVAAPSTTFDSALATGDSIIIEERAGDEVTNGFGRRTAPENVAVYSPAFDVTPNELITAFVTDRGIRTGGRAER